MGSCMYTDGSTGKNRISLCNTKEKCTIRLLYNPGIIIGIG